MRARTLFAILACLCFMIGQQCVPDSDRDGVPDTSDDCPNTPLCASVDAVGCPSDDDDDGVYNGCDECSGTDEDTTVYANGCAAEGPTGSVPSRCIGPDPRAKSIEYSLVNLTSATLATIRIKGTIDNVGTEAYLSSPGQQSIQLWEDNTMVAESPFTTLGVDVEATVEYQREWNLNDEFLPGRYKVIVTYDPDIFDDGNSDNDDCRLSNNIILRGTTGIASLLE